jgi:group I intron endonuclease
MATAGDLYTASAIYAIVNRETLDMYVGSAVAVNRRWGAHRRALSRKAHYNSRLQRAVNKYGLSVFDWEIVEFVNNPVNLISREQFWINFFKPSYNGRLIANSPLGTRHSAETRSKMSASAKKRGFSAQHKRNISLAKKGVPMPAAQRKYLSEINKGKVLSEETKSKLSAALKGNTNATGRKTKKGGV